MKKMIAIVLSLLMLLSSAALAEETLVTTIYDPQLAITQGDQVMTVNMQDLNIVLSAGKAGGVPTLNLDVFHKNDALLIGTLQIQGGKLLLDLESMTNTYCIPMPEQMAGTAQQGYDQLFDHLGDLHRMKLPMLPDIDLPKIDLAGALNAILTDAGAVDGGQKYTFELPYTMINQVISMVLPQLQQAAGNVPGIEQVIEPLNQLINSNSGLSIKGELIDKADRAELTADFYPVQGGTVAEQAAASLEINTEANGMFAQLKVLQGEAYQSIADMALTTDAEDSGIYFVISVMNPQASSDDDELAHFTASAYPEGEVQYFDASVMAGGQALDVSFSYGKQDGDDVAAFALVVPDQAAVSLNQVAEVAENGDKDGTIAASFAADNQAFDLIAGETEVVTDASLRPVKDAENAIDLQTISDEQKAQFESELQQAMGALMGYIYSLEPAA